jgi:hypothetical protein
MVKGKELGVRHGDAVIAFDEVMVKDLGSGEWCKVGFALDDVDALEELIGLGLEFLSLFFCGGLGTLERFLSCYS